MTIYPLRRGDCVIRELDSVVLTVDLPEHHVAVHLYRGDVGTVVLVHGDRGYEVEFTTLAGEIIAVVSLDTSSVRPIAAGEIAHTRSVPS